DRELVEEVFALLQRNAAPDGTVDAEPADVATRLRTKSSAREVEATLRILSHAGAYLNEGSRGTRVVVRLLATPQRIKRDLADEPMEIGLLRALWRVAGERLSQGAPIDLDGLPPGFGGRGATALLDRLQSRQFLEWKHASGGPRLTDVAGSLDRYPI